METRDKNGLTEREFLASYRQKDYPRPSVTVDIAVFQRGQGGLRALLIRRGGHPYLGCWALPGGFVNPDEEAHAAAARGRRRQRRALFRRLLSAKGDARPAHPARRGNPLARRGRG